MGFLQLKVFGRGSGGTLSSERVPPEKKDLFVVLTAFGYLEGAVDLFQEHNAGELVGEGHFRHRQPE